MEYLKLKNTLKKYKYDAHRICSPHETLKNLIKIRKDTDVVSFKKLKVMSIDKYDVFNVPVFAIFPSFSSKSFFLGRKQQCGKGLTKAQALVSGLMEFVERFCAYNVDKSKIIKGSYHSLRNSYSLWDFVPTNQIRKKYTKKEIDNRNLKWVLGYSLIRKKKVLVPINLAYIYEDDFLSYTDSNGLAAGNSIEEAILHGLCEVIERHLTEVIYRNKIETPKIDPSSVIDLDICYLINLFKSKGFKLYLNDYTYDLGIPTISVFAYNKNSSFKPPIRDFFCSTGTHPNKRIAIIRAFTEILQVRSAFLGLYKLHNVSPSKTPQKLSDNLKQNLIRRLGGKIISYDQIIDISKNNIKQEIKLLLEIMEEHGYDVIVVDLTNKQLNIPVVRVIVRGLQPVLPENPFDDGARISPHLDLFTRIVFQNKNL